jgi:phage-related baseplate assembly protein
VVLTQPAYTQLSAGQWANCTAVTLAQAIAAEHS